MRISVFPTLALAALAVTGSVGARTPAPPAEAGSRVVDEMLACKAIAAADARLSCFDRTAGAFADARSRHEIVVMDREGAKQVKGTVFGFSLPSLKLFGGNRDDEPEVTEINATLNGVQEANFGLYRLVLDNGGVWQTTEEQSGVPPRSGQPIKIRAGILGSYVASVGKGREMKVKRLR